MLSREEQTFKSLRRVPLKLPEVAGSRSKTRINKGEYLLKKDVELTPKVLIGSEVPITVQLKGVIVRATGKVLTDGHVGERVKVVNQASKKTLVGVVTESGEIAVSP
jgi:flagella basal body P-ring formation protein FlgA